MSTSRMAPELQPPRSSTGHHSLLPASRGGARYEEILGRRPSSYTVISWTFGRGSVIWRIWPAVLLHTLFACVVVSLTMSEVLKINIPSVMLTVLGVVIGFVIAYRVSSGYDRFWMGRVAWSDLIRTSRTTGRLIWFHVPPLIRQKTAEEIATGKTTRTTEELTKVMAEKRIALDLVAGFAIATKHHLRGEMGIYFEDLYKLVHVLQHASRQPKQSHHKSNFGHSTSVAPSYPIADPVIVSTENNGTYYDPQKPTIYGAHLHPRRSQSQLSNPNPSAESILQQPLLPSAMPDQHAFMSKFSADLIPFAGLLNTLNAVREDFWKKLTGGRQLEVLPPNIVAEREEYDEEAGIVDKKWVSRHVEKHVVPHPKGHPRLAGDGENFPLEILQYLSDWSSILEDRNTVPGNSMAGILSGIAAMEDSLTAMERILTTPLPFCYSVHIRHTVWLYLFFLPFQLVDQFGWHTIPGIATAAFIYLGFLAAGEEIEQPFGYEDNDLDLDLFCHEIIYADMERLKTVHCLNAYFGPPRGHPAKATLEANGNTDTAEVLVNVFGTD
jgi:putative membrane protein